MLVGQPKNIYKKINNNNNNNNNEEKDELISPWLKRLLNKAYIHWRAHILV